MVPKDTIRKYRAEPALMAILLLSAFLNFWDVRNQGFSNTYYAAAVRSMRENPAAGFFNSLDPAGFSIKMIQAFIAVPAVLAVYFLGSSSGGNSGLFSRVSQHCTEVPAGDRGGSSATDSSQSGQTLTGNSGASVFPGSGSSTSRGNAGAGGAGTLYDCAGYSGQSGT